MEGELGLIHVMELVQQWQVGRGLGADETCTEALYMHMPDPGLGGSAELC